MDDVRAVMDAAGCESAALFGYSEGGPMCILFAATYPERTRSLVLYGTYAKRCDPDDDYPWAPTREERERSADELERTWGENVDLSTDGPGADAALRPGSTRRGRAALSPAGARDLILMNSQADVRERAAERPVPDARAPPHRRPRRLESRRAATSPLGSRARASSSSTARITSPSIDA